VAVGSPDVLGACEQAERESRAAKPKAVQRMRMMMTPVGRWIRRLGAEHYAAGWRRQPPETNGSLATIDRRWIYGDLDLNRAHRRRTTHGRQWTRASATCSCSIMYARPRSCAPLSVSGGRSRVTSCVSHVPTCGSHTMAFSPRPRVQYPPELLFAARFRQEREFFCHSPTAMRGRPLAALLPRGDPSGRNRRAAADRRLRCTCPPPLDVSKEWQRNARLGAAHTPRASPNPSNPSHGATSS
jgi:hypothetical protein